MIERAALEQVDRQIGGACCPEDIFGALGDEEAAQRVALRRIYAALSRSCHPDLVIERDRPLAERIFADLARWKRAAEEKIVHRLYGDRMAAVPAMDVPPLTLCVRGRPITLRRILGEGAFATVRTAEAEAVGDEAGFAKIARDPADNDLIAREFAALRRIQEPQPDAAVETFFKTQRLYVPRPVTAFTVAGGAGEKHRAALLAVPKGRCFTSTTLRRERFPDGLEPKHVHWIFRRLLLTLWMAHLAGTVHGAVTPDHVLVYPGAHGLVLLDWTCSARIGEEHVPACDPEWKEFYPPEMARRALAEPSMDIYMAAATAIYLLGGDVAARTMPPTVAAPIADELRRCLRTDPRRRPQDAERFYQTFGEVIESVHGKRTYAELIV